MANLRENFSPRERLELRQDEFAQYKWLVSHTVVDDAGKFRDVRRYLAEAYATCAIRFAKDYAEPRGISWGVLDHKGTYHDMTFLTPVLALITLKGLAQQGLVVPKYLDEDELEDEK
jgi:hypothetical protein